MQKVIPMTKEELVKMLAEMKQAALDKIATPSLEHKAVKVKKVKIVNAPQKKMRKGSQKGQ